MNNIDNSIIKRIKEYINDADAILIGGGAGLSTAAGFEYGGKTFFENFKYMHDLYGYTDMYSAGFHPFSSSEEKWAYWSKMIYINRYSTLLMLKVMPWGNTLCGLLLYLLIPLVIAFVCLCIFYLSQKFFPHILSLLNGGRTS